MKVQLKVIEGKPQGASIPLSATPFVIGRDASCQLRPKHESVGSRHCRLSVKDDQVSVRDLGSAGGTLLNGRRLSPADSVIAHNGDQLKVGNLTFEVSIPVNPANHGLFGDDEPGEESPSAIANRLFQRNVGNTTGSGRGVGARLVTEMIEGLPVVLVDIPMLIDDGIIAFRRELRNLAERPNLTRVVLDFQKVRRMSSEAAAILLAFQERLHTRAAVVKLCEVSPEAMSALEAVGVVDRIPIALDVHDAIWSSW
jgi:anti-anti-sigma regulatory factor